MSCDFALYVLFILSIQQLVSDLQAALSRAREEHSRMAGDMQQRLSSSAAQFELLTQNIKQAAEQVREL